MQYAVSDVSDHDRYKLLISFVLPRPIAWVTTIGPNGTVNAAPFSFFNVFAEDPPLVMFAVNKRPDGRLKDTWNNIERTGQFVVNLTDEPMALECKTWQVINVKDDRQLIIGEGLRFHIRDELWDPKAMRVHMDKYHPIGRMFADRYCRTDDRVIFPAAEGPKKANAAD